MFIMSSIKHLLHLDDEKKNGIKFEIKNDKNAYFVNKFVLFACLNGTCTTSSNEIDNLRYINISCWLLK